MNIYGDASTVVTTVPFQTEAGVSVIPASASYRVLDQALAEIVATTPISLSAGQVDVDITVVGANNTLAVGERRILRVIETTMTDAAGSVFVRYDSYVIQSNTLLTVYTNSVQTYEQAILQSMDMVDLGYWDLATKAQRTAALIDAYFALTKFVYEIRSDINNRSRLEYLAPDSITNVGRLHELTANDWATLEADYPQFMLALRKAQIAEADTLLGGDNVSGRRRDGLMSETIGESSMMFRPGKPINLSVNPRTLRYLAGYVKYGLSLTRG